MEREQEIQLANFAEQYGSIRKNIDVASDELTAILARTADALAAAEKARIDKVALQDSIAELEVARYSIRADIQVLERSLDERNTMLEDKKKSFDAELREIHTDFNKRKKAELDEFESIQGDIARSEIYRDSLEQEIASLEADSILKESNNLALLERGREFAEKSSQLASVITGQLGEMRDNDAKIAAQDAKFSENELALSQFKENVRRFYTKMQEDAKDILILQMRWKNMYADKGVSTAFSENPMPELPIRL